MNSLWSHDAPCVSSFDYNYKYNISNKDCMTNKIAIDHFGYPSNVHFSNTSYTLGFGHLFEGNLQPYQLFNPVCQRYESCSFEVPKCYYNLVNDVSQMNNIQLQQDSIINHKVNEAMEAIRKTIQNFEKQYDCSMSSILYRYNPIMNNCNQNNIVKTAELLERAANALSVPTSNQT